MTPKRKSLPHVLAPVCNRPELTQLADHLWRIDLENASPATATADALAHLPRMKGAEAKASNPAAGKRGNAHGLELADAAPAPAARKRRTQTDDGQAELF